MMARSQAQYAVESMVRFGVPRSIARIVRRNAATYAAIQERYASGYDRSYWLRGTYVERYDHALEALDEKREPRIEKRITELLAPYNITPRFAGDPRGYAVTLITPNGDYNSWGDKEYGWGIA